LIVPLSLIALPAIASAATPLPSNAWWEKVTIRMTGGGEAQGCQYQTSRPAADAADCKVVGGSTSAQPASTSDGYSAITFERRFNPGEAPGDSSIQQGEKLLGMKVMALAIDGAGKVSGCRVVNATGDTGLSYGCEEASNEKFAANGAAATAPDRHGFMTILAYGHNEHVV
jgi:hypothetical protein